MNVLINELSNLENANSQLENDFNLQKNKLLKEFEDKKSDYVKKKRNELDDEISSYRRELREALNDKIDRLKRDTELNIETLMSAYERSKGNRLKDALRELLGEKL